MDETLQTPIDSAEPTDSPADDGLSSLLSEFTTATETKLGTEHTRTSEPAAETAPVASKPELPTDPADPNFWSSVNALAQSLEEQRAGINPDMRGQIDNLTNAFRQVQAGIALEQDKSDFNRIIGTANKEYLAEFPHLPSDYAERWLKAEAISNPQLTQAFDSRYQSPAHERHAERALRKAFSRMRDEAARMPDPNITEDVAAVTAAVRGASHSPPAARQPNLGRMSNAEFNKYVQDQHGFNPEL